MTIKMSGGVSRQPYMESSGNGHDSNESIKDVWVGNFEEEFSHIRKLIKTYRYVAMDTEFPGVVLKPVIEYTNQTDYQYQLLRCNVDILKIIQIGISLFDENGKTPPGISTWQFNFQFDLTNDMYAQDSIDLLQNSGLQFSRHCNEGIIPNDFAIMLITSGLILNPKVTFLSFHSGYDFGYLLRMLTGKKMPMSESEFFDDLKAWIPVIYDVKFLMKSCKNLKGGLQEVSEQLELQRVGPKHQAGSDSLLTGHTFFKMRELYFEGNIDNEKYCGHLYGLGSQYIQNSAELAGSISHSLNVVNAINATSTASVVIASSVNEAETQIQDI